MSDGDTGGVVKAITVSALLIGAAFVLYQVLKPFLKIAEDIGKGLEDLEDAAGWVAHLPGRVGAAISDWWNSNCQVKLRPQFLSPQSIADHLANSKHRTANDGVAEVIASYTVTLAMAASIPFTTQGQVASAMPADAVTQPMIDAMRRAAEEANGGNTGDYNATAWAAMYIISWWKIAAFGGIGSNGAPFLIFKCDPPTAWTPAVLARAQASVAEVAGWFWVRMYGQLPNMSGDPFQNKNPFIPFSITSGYTGMQ